MGQSKLQASRDRKFATFNILIQATFIFLTLYVLKPSPNFTFLIFLFSFIVTMINLSRNFNVFIALPIVVLTFLGLQLALLLLTPIFPEPISIDSLSIPVSLLPWVITLSFSYSESGDQKKGKNTIKITGWTVILLPSAFATCIFVQTVLRFPSGWTFWALGGDARNHLLYSVTTSVSDGLSTSVLSGGPTFPAAQVALFAKPNAENLDLQMYFESLTLAQFFYLVLGSIMFALITNRLASQKPFIKSLLTLIAGSIPFSGLFAGVLQRDGFISISLLLVILLSVVMIYIEILNPNNSENLRRRLFYFGFSITPILVLLTWTPFLVFCAIFVIFGFIEINTTSVQSKLILGCIFVLNLSIALYCLEPLIEFKSASEQFTLRGAITAPTLISFLAVLVMIALLINMNAIRNYRNGSLRKLLLIFLFTGLPNLYFISLQPPEIVWNYYPSKYGWVWIVLVLPFLLIALSLSITEVVSKIVSRIQILSFRPAESAIKLLSILIIIYFSIMQVYPAVQSPWLQIWFNSFQKGQFGVQSYVLDGIGAPSPQVVQRINLIHEEKRQPVFWRYFSNPSEERLGNFHLVLYAFERDGSNNPISDRLSYWAYFADNSKFESLCELIEENPQGFLIITKIDGLTTEIESQCRVSNKNIEVVKDFLNGTS